MKKTKFPGIFEQRKGKRRVLATENFNPGKQVYDEDLIREGQVEYRTWNPNRSKLAAGILKGVKNVGIEPGSIVLYLGASTGTTPSHVSDIVGKKGFVFGVEFAPRVMRKFVFLCEERENMCPLFFDANNPDAYKSKMCSEVDVVYMDVAQKNQTQIFLKNCDMFLRKGGIGIFAVKARSINVAERPRKIFEEVKKELQKHFNILDFVVLDPFEMDHALFVCKK